MPFAARPHERPISDDVPGFVVHSHLRWDFVWQRPQQILSRIARVNPVLFVEEPVVLDDVRHPSLELTLPLPNVARAVPRLPRPIGERYDDAIAAIRVLVERARRSALLGGRFERIVQWFYTPMPAPEMLGAQGEVGVVFDCMDELARFRFAPPDLARRERLLLSRADVVFTGGYRLFESKSRFHDNVHFFGCGVDVAHFGAARDPELPIPGDLAGVSSKVLGYFGVIDERLDYDLLRALARTCPEWMIAMVGPVVKVDPRELPDEPNIRWLGQRHYAELPAYVKAFDVCLMPFALNDATEYINPTKTLEYMAAGKPIVSTGVPDVVRNFGEIVAVARDHAEFIASVSEAVRRVDHARTAAGIERASRESWDAIVDRMRALIDEALIARAVERDVEDVLAADLTESAPPIVPLAGTDTDGGARETAADIA